MPSGALPKLSVIMPAYNARETLAEAVESILNQTFDDFEFLIFDDASTDDTPAILERYAASDRRIRVFRSEQNMNYSHWLNKGLECASASLVARMDADDVSMPHRFEMQYAFLSAHPEITLCAGQLEYYETGEITKLSLDDAGIRLDLLRDSSMPHPAWMFRKEALIAAGGYDPSYTPADDYAMLTALTAMPGVRFANLPDVLLKYRLHLDKDRTAYRERQQRNAGRVRDTLGRRFVPEAEREELDAHALVCGYGTGFRAAELAACLAWVQKLLAANAKKKICAPDSFREFLQKRWFDICFESPELSRFWSPGFTIAGLTPGMRASLLRSWLVALLHRLQRKLLPSRFRCKDIFKLSVG